MAYKRTSNRSRARRTPRRRAPMRRRPVRRTRKTTYKRRATRTQLDSETAQQLAVVLNPFSSATEQPKIPDGSRNHSLGVSYKNSGVLVGTTGSTTGITVVLFPGRRSFAMSWKGTPSTPDAIPEETFYSTPETLTRAAGVWSDEDQLDAWRTVSQGIKLRDISATEKNNGWWCAVRYRPRCSDSNDNGWSTSILTEDDAPDLTGLGEYTKWANDPSYSSGSLKTIGMKNFNLCPETSDPSWTSWIGDRNLDIIVIYIRGGGEENILYNIATNHETSYQSTSVLNKYQTQTRQVMPATLSAVQIKRRYMCKRAAS